MIQSKTAARAKSYFNDALLKTDYYVNDQELNGLFRGQIAKKLQIEGRVGKDVFHSLCENINPITGETLTPQKKNNRTVGYDINFHCPKSVSILHALSKDRQILDAFHTSVLDTMADIEKDAKTRVRKDGKDENRSSEGLLYADFVHQTARPVNEALPDPHLHCHCFVFNVTWDQIEKRYKAGQFRNINRDMPYYQAIFHKRLADNLMGLGYKVTPTKAAFEIEGVPQRFIDLLSKRTNQIGQIAKDQNISDAKELDKLGAKSRAKKKKGLTMLELKNHWVDQLKAMGIENDLKDVILKHATPIAAQYLPAKEAINYSVEHNFERASVVAERKLLQTAIRYALGNPSLTVESIKKAFLKDENIIKKKDGDILSCSTLEVVQEELAIIKFVKDAQWNHCPAYTSAPSLSLEGEQAEAVGHVLTTQKPVSIIMGRAGTGKTTLMKEAVRKFNQAGKSVLIAAPTAEASRGVLRQEGFEEAETVAKLLADKSLQDRLADQVLWIDEAGLLGAKDMHALLRLAKSKNAQLILSGDTNQHASVIRGDALRLLHEVAGVDTIQVSKIYRQKQEQYRAAMEALSIGNAEKAYALLSDLGAIEEVDPNHGVKELAEEYLAQLKRNKSALVVSPTHHQCKVVTEAIRQSLKADKQIGQADHIVDQLINLSFTDVEKTQSQSYQKGMVIRLNRKTETLPAYSYCTVQSASRHKLNILDAKGSPHELPYEDLKQAEVYQKNQIALAKNDRIRVTRNGKDANKRRLNNGQELILKRFQKDGTIIAQSPNSKCEYALQKDFNHLDHCYCITSHASQGKTVDTVLVSQPSATFGASDLKQFYVSATRGREMLKIYTDDKEGLLDHITALKKRKSALELLGFNDNANALLENQSVLNGQTAANERYILQNILISIALYAVVIFANNSYL